MGYFDGLTDASFKKSNSGDDLFYPWGIFSSGYILPSSDIKNEIRSFIKKTHIFSLSTLLIVQIFISPWLHLIWLPFYVVWYYFWVKKATRSFKKSNEKLKTSESYSNSAKSHNLTTLIFLEILSLLFVLGGLFITFKEGAVLAGLFSIVFFGLCSFAIGYMIIKKVQSTHKP